MLLLIRHERIIIVLSLFLLLLTPTCLAQRRYFAQNRLPDISSSEPSASVDFEYIDKQIETYYETERKAALILDQRTLTEEEILNSYDGVCYGPSGKETYYNLPMEKVIKDIRKRGFTHEEYPYNVRDDGVKTLGGYVMVAADLDKYNKGDIIETSLGKGIVCDTGTFAQANSDQIDIATNW